MTGLVRYVLWVIDLKPRQDGILVVGHTARSMASAAPARQSQGRHQRQRQPPRDPTRRRAGRRDGVTAVLALDLGALSRLFIVVDGRVVIVVVTLRGAGDRGAISGPGFDAREGRLVQPPASLAADEPSARVPSIAGTTYSSTRPTSPWGQQTRSSSAYAPGSSSSGIS